MYVGGYADCFWHLGAYKACDAAHSVPSNLQQFVPADGASAAFPHSCARYEELCECIGEACELYLVFYEMLQEAPQSHTQQILHSVRTCGEAVKTSNMSNAESPAPVHVAETAVSVTTVPVR